MPCLQGHQDGISGRTSQLDLHPDHQAKRIKDVWHSLSLAEDGILMVNGNRIYVPPGARKTILTGLHTSHCGFDKTLATSSQLYNWPAMKYDIRALIDK